MIFFTKSNKMPGIIYNIYTPSTYTALMIVTNPLVPPAPGQAAATVSPVANAPRPAERESERPVEASERSGAREPESRERGRGQNLDITV